MTIKKLETELQEINKKLDDNVKAVIDESSLTKKGTKKRKKTVRDSMSCGRMFGR